MGEFEIWINHLNFSFQSLVTDSVLQRAAGPPYGSIPRSVTR